MDLSELVTQLDWSLDTSLAIHELHRDDPVIELWQIMRVSERPGDYHSKAL